MSKELLELAERCEKATGPDRGLDKAIAAVVHLKQLTYQSPEWIKDPEFTASLDAAMTLVPEGALWKVDHGITWSDEQSTSNGRNYRAGVGIGDVPAKWSDGVSAASPAFALCAAALKARAHKEEAS
jgi:hypothetical protein